MEIPSVVCVHILKCPKSLAFVVFKAKKASPRPLHIEGKA